MFSASLTDKKKGKKSKLMIYLSFVKLYFSLTFNYVQFNQINIDVKVPALPPARHARLPNRQCHAFLQERLKKAMCDLERARPKNVRPFTLEKSGGGVKKR